MPTPTPAELEILNVLWEKGECRVQEVHDQLNQNRSTGYTTTLKSMQVMVQKGLLERRPEGRGHVYFPAVAETHTRNTLLTRFINSAFGGSKSKLLVQLLGNSEITRDEIDEIKAFLNKVEDQ